jgi:hypothetical protein
LRGRHRKEHHKRKSGHPFGMAALGSGSPREEYSVREEVTEDCMKSSPRTSMEGKNSPQAHGKGIADRLREGVPTRLSPRMGAAILQ